MASQMDIEKRRVAQPLLQVDEELNTLDKGPNYTSASLSSSQNAFWSHWFSKLSMWYLHGILILFYSTIFLTLFISSIQNRSYQTRFLPCTISSCAAIVDLDSNLSVVPAREAISWEFRYFPTTIDNNPYAGGPRPELHQAWHRLLRSACIRHRGND